MRASPGQWARYLLLMLAVAAWVGAGMWLKARLGYPEGFGHSCTGRNCYLTALSHSQALLDDGRAEATALYVWYWSLPVIAPIVIGIALFRRR